mmetsp:Transcript_26012/g.29765  ORF Transcript_26012/g.29765 Transcript_26012/m.29765 type:complete len:174 (+) Transcript_26012:37-558(+)
MWKPGTPKPLVLSHTTLPGKMPTGKKKLSVATMGMRFMQKRNFTLSGEVASSLSSKSNQKKDTEPKIYEESRVSFDRCTNSDMYGIQSDLIGRRSFGGFKKSVDDNWRACLRGGREDDNKNNSGNPEITDSELRRQYVKLRRGSNSIDCIGRKRKSKFSSAQRDRSDSFKRRK